MESAVYSLWTINARNLVKNKIFIAKEWHIQFSEIDRLPFYEYEWILEEINIIQKQQEEKNKEEEKKYANMQNSFKQPSFNIPKMNMPSLNMPKI